MYMKKFFWERKNANNKGENNEVVLNFHTFRLWSMFSECRWSSSSVSQTLSSDAQVPGKHKAIFISSVINV